jgi:hypothetical protein
MGQQNDFLVAHECCAEVLAQAGIPGEHGPLIRKALAALTDAQISQFSHFRKKLRLARRRLVQAGILPRVDGPQRAALDGRRLEKIKRRAAAARSKAT